MGVKSTLAAVTHTVAHKAAAQANGQNADLIRQNAQAHIDDALYALRELVKSLPNGDANTATLNAQITALS